MTQQDVAVEVTPEDIQSVMRTNPMVTLQIQNKALMRKVLEVQAEIEKLKHELEDIQREVDKKELKSTPTK